MKKTSFIFMFLTSVFSAVIDRDSDQFREILELRIESEKIMNNTIDIINDKNNNDNTRLIHYKKCVAADEPLFRKVLQLLNKISYNQTTEAYLTTKKAVLALDRIHSVNNTNYDLRKKTSIVTDIIYALNIARRHLELEGIFPFDNY
uniref:Prolyl 4-hydroxylase alpha-subunit N-terminal domain-containing protein n=1 Tax=Clastoptera arizonana TaxID=38151 RepID=A0A1B6D2B1_9HEMI